MDHSSPRIGSNQGAAGKLSKIIDVHSHAVLNIGEQVPLANQARWSVEGALSLMDANEIAVTILSAPGAANYAEDKEAVEISRRINEALAEIVAKHPQRFGAIATLPGKTIDGSLSEMEYALDALKMDGVSTLTSVEDIYLGDSRFDPWFDEMNRRKVTLFMHPTVARASLAVDLQIDISMLEFMFDTTRMLTNMIFTGAKRRFSDIRMISAHAGGTIPYLVTRIQTLELTFGPGPNRVPLTAEEVKQGFASFYYDLTAGTSRAQLGAIRELVPASQLLMGLDSPYMPEWSFGPAIRDLEQWDGFTQDDIDRIAHKNACLLYPTVAARAGYAMDPVRSAL
jgi:predicted TIM-barrel fold metal-dependent hydrolase